MADLHHVTNEAGDHFIGFEADGVFIPVHSVSAARVAQLQERAASLKERLDAGNDEAAEDAVAQLPISTKTTTRKKAEGGES